MRTAFSATIFAAMVLICSIGMGLSSAQADGTLESIDSETEAAAAAQALLGLGTLLEDIDTRLAVRGVSVETFSDTCLPYIGKTVSGNPAWIVSFANFESVLSQVEGLPKPVDSPRECDVWLDSLEGRLLRVEIISLSSENPYDVDPTKEQLETEARAHGEEYLGQPTVSPRVTVIEALAAGGRHVVPYVASAPRIVFRYVAMKGAYTNGSNEFPAWLIRLHGVGVDRVSARSGPIESRATRYVVNALSGELMGRFAVGYDTRE